MLNFQKQPLRLYYVQRIDFHLQQHFVGNTKYFKKCVFQLYQRDYMYKYPRMFSLLVKNYCLEDNLYLKEIGRNSLQPLIFQVIYQYNIKKKNDNLIKMMPAILQYELKSNCQDQLLFFFANRIFIDHYPQERQIAKRTLVTIINKYNLPVIDNFSQNKVQVSSQSQIQIESSYEPSLSKPILQEGQVTQQMIKQRNQQNEFEHMLRPRISLHDKNQIMSYIASLTCPKTQIYKFCRSIQNVLPQYRRYNEERIHHVAAILIFSNRFNNKMVKRYQFESSNITVKQAQNRATMGLLELIWFEYPWLWRLYIQWQKKAGK